MSERERERLERGVPRAAFVLFNIFISNVRETSYEYEYCAKAHSRASSS